MKSIEDVIGKVEEWKGKNVTYKYLPGGLTNRNYKLDVNGESYVVRIPGQKTDIFIDREVELHNTISASNTGVGAKVFKFFKPDYIIITGFINGNLMSSNSLREDNERIVKAVKAIKKIHTDADFISRFVMFNKFRDYIAIVKKHSMKLPEGFIDAKRVVEDIEKIFWEKDSKLVPCHNDLLAENFIETGDTMRIIDWELSGMNDPCFDLGDFSVEIGFNEDQDRLIIETYFGEFRENQFCWLNIYKYMADILWTLWAIIQHNLSDINFDYWEYGMNRFNRAMNAINSESFRYWRKNL